MGDIWDPVQRGKYWTGNIRMEGLKVKATGERGMTKEKFTKNWGLVVLPEVKIHNTLHTFF